MDGGIRSDWCDDPVAFPQTPDGSFPRRPNLRAIGSGKWFQSGPLCFVCVSLGLGTDSLRRVGHRVRPTLSNVLHPRDQGSLDRDRRGCRGPERIRRWPPRKFPRRCVHRGQLAGTRSRRVWWHDRGFRVSTAAWAQVFDGAMQQSDAVRDYVFPIFEAEAHGHSRNVKAFRGTGFFIGSRGYALTAAHVVTDPPPDLPLSAVLTNGGQWLGFDVSGHELHPKEDVAILRISPPGGPQQAWRSILQADPTQHQSSAHYFMWGFPEDTVFELVDEASGTAHPLPELVYTEGHVRRRVANDTLPNLRGSQFFELSEAAGDGCSGGPLLLNTPRPRTGPWHLIGVYLGERVMSADKQLRQVFPAAAKIRGYAVRLDVMLDWRPEILAGRTLLDELQDLPELNASD